MSTPHKFFGSLFVFTFYKLFEGIAITTHGINSVPLSWNAWGTFSLFFWSLNDNG